MKINLKRSAILGISALVLSTSLIASPAQAATRKVTVKATNYNKAPLIKKGTTKVTYKKSNAYFRFKAPAAGTYKFTFSQINAYNKADKKDNFVNGYLKFSKLNTGYLDYLEVKTNYGKYDNLQMCSKNFYDSWYSFGKHSKKKPDSYLKTRYANVKLKKGQSVWIDGFFAGVKNSNVTFLVNVKKA